MKLPDDILRKITKYTNIKSYNKQSRLINNEKYMYLVSYIVVHTNLDEITSLNAHNNWLFKNATDAHIEFIKLIKEQVFHIYNFSSNENLKKFKLQIQDIQDIEQIPNGKIIIDYTDYPHDPHVIFTSYKGHLKNRKLSHNITIKIMRENGIINDLIEIKLTKIKFSKLI